MKNEPFLIDDKLAYRLVARQFPQWKHLPIESVARNGWDNKTFHLGKEFLIRMPTRKEYAAQVEKEQMWLPFLGPLLPFAIPEPVAMGIPGDSYPWKWSVYRWIEGETATEGHITDLNNLAKDLAGFLLALQSIDTTGGPIAGAHSFWRGGPLLTYDDETRKAIALLKGKIDTDAATKLWETALESRWLGKPVWVHGDMSSGNLLLKVGKLHAVIDFGQLAVGDPACDLAIAWTLFTGEKCRKIFREKLPLDAHTWTRGRAWTLWKALIVAAGFTNPNNAEAVRCFSIIDTVLRDPE
ncbi:MAG: aminoglycoside phosphotransferase family protein [Verrucomicrobia bacterium]|nr:aminoglycoside phosphotransferase family protein [Verrucomicrobiota bacterium]